MPKMTLAQARADWAAVKPNFDIIENDDGVLGKLAGFTPDTNKPVVIWAKNGIGFPDLSKQVKLYQAKHNLRKSMQEEQPVSEAEDLFGNESNDGPEDMFGESNDDTDSGVEDFLGEEPAPKATAAPRKGPKPDRYRVNFTLKRPDADTLEGNPNALLNSVVEVVVVDKKTDKPAASTKMQLKDLRVQGLVETAYLGLQKIFAKETKNKEPDERIAWLKAALKKAAAGDVSDFSTERKRRRTGGRKRAGYPVEVEAISMVRGIALSEVETLWRSLPDEGREKVWNQPAYHADYEAKREELLAARAGVKPDTDALLDKLLA